MQIQFPMWLSRWCARRYLSQAEHDLVDRLFTNPHRKQVVIEKDVLGGIFVLPFTFVRKPGA